MNFLSSNIILDIIIPVYNEDAVILDTLRSLAEEVSTPFRVLICYDYEEDSTLSAIRLNGDQGVNLEFVRNCRSGPHGAVLSGFNHGRSPYVLVLPADDNFNGVIVDKMVDQAILGADVVCASRFIKGGSMVGCPLYKGLIVRLAAFTLFHFGRIPTRDGTNGFRLFSRRLLDTVEIESSEGFSYSIELVAKCHRLRWKIAEIPSQWYERIAGKSRFKIFRWMPAYLRWYFYVFRTTWLCRSPETVRCRNLQQ
jgi:dolichol-phosphate mannosyltransferase